MKSAICNLLLSALLEQSDQSFQLRAREMPELLFMCSVYGMVELSKQLETSLGNSSVNQAPVGGVACAVDQARFFESIEQPRNIRHLRDKPFPNVFPAKPARG